jgi:hypothetical protein
VASPARGEFSLAAIAAVASILPATTGGPLWSVLALLVVAGGLAALGLRVRRKAATAQAEGGPGGPEEATGARQG